MTGSPDTVEDSASSRAGEERAIPGVVVIASRGRPMLRVLRVGEEQLVLGRSHPLLEADDRLSRVHARISWRDDAWRIEDAESRNGTFVNGAQITGSVRQSAPRVLRVGQTVCIPVRDVTPFERFEASGLVRTDGFIAGARSSAMFASVEQAAKQNDTLLVRGETGAGKEHVARVFHRAGDFANGAFVPVNCAAIPEGVAERLLFGARKGAFSGASADATGYAQAAEDGVLFLDEIGELELDVQAKLLRFLETREVLPVGASKPRIVRTGIALATHRDLRADVARGRFRADLLYRVAECEVVVPPLRDRPEEIPWLAARELTAIDSSLTADARLVESCVLRPWPGNVRELLGAIRRAARAAAARGARVVAGDDLDVDAGTEIVAASERISDVPSEPPPSREAIEGALATHGGNVSAAARALGLHRTQLYRYMKRHGLE